MKNTTALSILITAVLSWSAMANTPTKCERAFSQKKPATTSTSTKRNPENKTTAKKPNKKQIAEELLSAFTENDFAKVKELIVEYPFLKERDIRFNSGKLIEQIPEKHRVWCPEGWGLLQLATYFKKSSWIQHLLQLGVNPRTRKRQKVGSIESNAFHIAIKLHYKHGVSLISGVDSIMSKRGKQKGHFIDEKDEKKMTPFALAAMGTSYFSRRMNDSHSTSDAQAFFESSDILDIVLKHRPSGEVKVPVFLNGRYVSMDGFELAEHLGERAIINKAYTSLRKSANYFLHKKLGNDLQILKDYEHPFPKRRPH